MTGSDKIKAEKSTGILFTEYVNTYPDSPPRRSYLRTCVELKLKPLPELIKLSTSELRELLWQYAWDREHKIDVLKGAAA